MLPTNTYGSGSWAMRVVMAWLKLAPETVGGGHGRGRGGAQVVGPQQDGHIPRLLVNGLGGLARSSRHLGPGDRVVGGMAGDRRVELPDALIVAGDAVVAGISGGPGLAGVVAIGTADVIGPGDRVADGGHAGW